MFLIILEEKTIFSSRPLGGLSTTGVSRLDMKKKTKHASGSGSGKACSCPKLKPRYISFARWVRLTLVSFAVTTLFFTLEALLHYNIGKTGKLGLSHFPPAKEALEIVGVVMIFAALSAATAILIQKYMFPLHLPPECTVRPRIPKEVERAYEDAKEAVTSTLNGSGGSFK